jgi:hypothetical protein
MSLAIPAMAMVFRIPPIPEIANWSAYKTIGNSKSNTCHYIDGNKSPKYASEIPVRKDA